MPVCTLSRFTPVWLCVTLWTAVCQVPLSLEFSRQEYWSGLPCPSPGDLRTHGLNMHLLHCMHPALTGSASVTWEAHGTWPKKKKIIQAIKTNHPIFLGLSPTETAHTPHCSVCFTLGCSHLLSSPCLRVSLAFWDRLRCLWNVYCSKEVHSYLGLCLPLIFCDETQRIWVL